MSINIFEWIGYAASIVVAISLLMTSILKFRWINLTGSVLFAIYGFLIHAWPVCFFNSAIVFINIYFLYKIYSKKEEFEILATSENEVLFSKFIEFHRTEIKKISPDFDFNLKGKEFNYFITRDMTLVGIFIAHKESETLIKVDLDFVTPQYRDFKNGTFLYDFLNNSFKKSGITQIVAMAETQAHQQYLEEMGYKNIEKEQYLKFL